MSPGEPARLPAFLWALALGNLVVGTGGFMIGGIVEPLSQALGTSVSTTGQLMTVYSAANAVAAPLLVAVAGPTPRVRRPRVARRGDANATWTVW